MGLERQNVDKINNGYVTKRYTGTWLAHVCSVINASGKLQSTREESYSKSPVLATLTPLSCLATSSTQLLMSLQLH